MDGKCICQTGMRRSALSLSCEWEIDKVCIKVGQYTKLCRDLCMKGHKCEASVFGVQLCSVCRAVGAHLAHKQCPVDSKIQPELIPGPPALEGGHSYQQIYLLLIFLTYETLSDNLASTPSLFEPLSHYQVNMTRSRHIILTTCVRSVNLQNHLENFWNSADYLLCLNAQVKQIQSPPIGFFLQTYHTYWSNLVLKIYCHPFSLYAVPAMLRKGEGQSSGRMQRQEYGVFRRGAYVYVCRGVHTG